MYVNPTQYIAPVASIIIGIVPVIYLRKDGMLFAIAAAAYFIAIVCKIVVEGVFSGFFGERSLATYIAYGCLTAVFEIGLAYALVHLYSGSYRPWKGWAYGSYLAFFENSILVGGLSLFTLLIVNVAVIPGTGTDAYAANAIPIDIPSAFERLTSFIAHAAWGYFAFYAALQKKPLMVLPAVPLAFIDSIAAWWDLTHAISYPLLVAILFAFVVVVTVLALYLTSQWNESVAGLSRKSAKTDGE